MFSIGFFSRLAVMSTLWAISIAIAFAAESASEQAVRTALLFNFLKFTEWPVSPVGNAPMKICIATNDPIQIGAMEMLGDRRVRDRPLGVVRIGSQLDCDVIYVDSRQGWSRISDRYASRPVLTVGSYAGFVTDGGMIEIGWQNGGTRFDINLAEARRAGLRFYPQLLRLSRRIVE
jgi:hypothetical protein